MSDTIPADEPILDGDEPTTPTSGFRGLPGWKKILIVGAGVLIVIGIALMPFSGSDSRDLSTGAGLPDGGAGLVQGGTTTGTEKADESLSPAFLRLGFSFFVGFAIGYAFRAFLRVALIVIGLQLIALFGLSYLDWITVNWDAMGGFFDGFMDRIKGEAEEFRTFVTGSLPTAGLASLGLFAGFRKR